LKNANKQQPADVASSSRDDYDEEMRLSCLYLRKATGVLEYLRNEFLSDNNKIIEEIAHGKANELLKMPELNKTGCESIQYYCNAIGQMIAIQASILSEACTPSVLCKLCVQTFQLFDQVKNSSDRLPNTIKVSDMFRILATQYRIIYRTLALYYLAIDTNKNEKSGLSVALIITANNQLEEIYILNHLQVKSSINDLEILSSAVRELQVDCKKLEQKYERENRTVFREPIPDISEIPKVIPEGVLIPQSIPFKLTVEKPM
jgi:hypothetical protein